jgi:uncharacterized protein (UPF0332 family)
VGANTVQYLIDRGRLEQIVSAELDRNVEALMDRARRRLATASAALDLGDIDGAYSAGYDAYRISAEALLARQGLRATGGEGSHVTVEDAISAQFAATISSFAKPSFERIRRTRHTAQYFDPDAPPITADDAEWAIGNARRAVTGAGQLVDSSTLELF